MFQLRMGFALILIDFEKQVNLGRPKKIGGFHTKIDSGNKILKKKKKKGACVAFFQSILSSSSPAGREKNRRALLEIKRAPFS